MAKIKSNYHADWLNLTDRSGLVLSEPVLMEQYPDGFSSPNSWLAKQLKHSYEKFDLNDDENGSLSFVDAIFSLLKHKIQKSNDISAEMKLYLPEYAQELKPHRVLDVGLPIPVYVAQKTQNLKTNENIDGRWKASPIAKIERLIKSLSLPCGILTNGYQFRLIYISSEGSTNYIEFDFEGMMQESKLLTAFCTIFSPQLLSNIKTLAEESHKKQIEITDQLGLQVREAVKKFVSILDRCDKESEHALLEGVATDAIYQMSVTTIIKLVFVLYAEQKAMLPHGEMLYDRAYGVHALISELTEQKASLMIEHRNDAYQQLLALFDLIYSGSTHPDMQSPRYGGEIFDPHKYPALCDARLNPSNHEIYEILWLLTHAESKIGRETITQIFSYHSLNVEHIGYIYEGLLAYTVARSGVTSLVKLNPKENELAVRVDELLAISSDKLGEYIKSNTQSNKAPTAKQLEKRFEPDEDELSKLSQLESNTAKELRDYATLIHEAIPSHSLYITTSSRRRATGAHYTPEALTAKMVKATLDMHLYEGDNLKTPKEILSLKIADIAMGSGAFLVQAIRYMSERLVESWQIAANESDEPLCMPYATPCKNTNELLIPSEYDEQKRHAKRFVARECIYGVDINPLAVEIAKISIWLETLDKSLPFTFVDHALKHGDSLVGVKDETEAAKLLKEHSNLFDILDDKTLREAIRLRKEVERLSDLEIEKKKELLAKSEALLQEAKSTLNRLSALSIDPEGDYEPFAYMLEYPEVMIDGGGFDAIIGNPPFLGGRKITSFFGKEYRDYLVEAIANNKDGAADFVAYFFLRAVELLKPNGTFGLLATNTIAEGDTREVGLVQILNDGEIYAAFHKEPWEGHASVETSRVHYIKGATDKPKILNGVEVEFISPFLSAQDDKKPNVLKANENRSFIGSYVLGMGFTMTPDEAKEILDEKPHYTHVLFPYINGDDLNSSPMQSPSRFVINFWDWSLERAREYPELLAQVEERVKPERLKKEGAHYQIARDYYWKHFNERPRLYHAIGRGGSFEKHPSDFEYPQEPMERVLVKVLTSKYMGFIFKNNDLTFDQTNIIIPYDKNAFFALLKSSFHVEWSIKNGATLETRLRYTPSDCFETFPFPEILPANPALCDFSHPLVQKLEKLGEEYHTLRAEMMKSLNIGLTKLYNAFHSTKELRDDFVRLRELHRHIDETVKESYGWNDIDLAHNFYEVPYLPANDRVRYTIAEPARLEILRRLYKLNTERYEAELANGLWEKKKPKQTAKKTKTTQEGLF